MAPKPFAGAEAGFIRSRRIFKNAAKSSCSKSKGNEISREDDKWNHGAFTKVLLDALGKDADENHDGLISMSELTYYVATHVPALTEGQQHPGVEQRFEGEVFIAGQ